MNSSQPNRGTTPEACDVLVIGGGPAGSTIAALLAAQGRKVVLVEKAHHPRFHIGESLLPCNVELFERLGLKEQVDKIGMPKFGIEFVSPDHEHRSYVDFAEAWDKTKPSAWQVRRSDLDELLFRNATKRGATTLEGCKVREVTFDADVVSFRELLELFFTIHDPTQLNRQGNDVGTQYRSAIFTHSPEQKQVAEQVIAEMTEKKVWGKPIVTEIAPASKFWIAEDYHQEYFARTGNANPYCSVIVAPKVAKFRKQFVDRLKR